MSSRRWMWGALATTLAAALWTALSADESASPAAASAAHAASGHGAVAASNGAPADSSIGGEGGAAGAPAQAPAVEGVPAERAPADAALADAASAAAAPERPAVSRTTVDLFAAYSWQLPPPSAPTGPPPRPVAPPLPYVYAGRVTDAGKTQYLLMEQNTLHQIAAGATFGDYVLESASEAQLVFLHRPTGEHQTLAIAPQASLP